MCENTAFISAELQNTITEINKQTNQNVLPEHVNSHKTSITVFSHFKLAENSNDKLIN